MAWWSGRAWLSFFSAMETPSHAALKRLARAFLVRIGCCVAAAEVLCPISRYRLDAAGYADDALSLPPRGERALATLWSLNALLSDLDTTARVVTRATRRGALRTPRTVIIECKRSRADFFRDGEDVASALLERERLRARRHDIEETLVKPLEPHLRASGTALFPELESWDFARSRTPAHLRVQRELRLLERRLYGHTKFSRLVKYRLADRLLVLAPSGLLRPSELPEGWGLIECPSRDLRRGAFDSLDLRAQSEHVVGDSLQSPGLLDLPIRLTIEPPEHATLPLRRARLLRNIGVALMRQR